MPSSRIDGWTRACFLAVAAVAVSVLLSWAFDLGDVTLPGRQPRPMAHSTATLLLFSAIAMWWRHESPHSATSRWVARLVGLGVIVFSLVALWTIPWSAAADIPRGVMVPTTALVFVLVGASAAAGAVTMPQGIDHQLQATLGLLIAMSGSVVLFGHALNVSLVAGQPVPALSTGIAFVLIGAGRVLGVGARSWQMLVSRPSTSRQMQRNRRWAWIVSVILVVGFVATFFLMALRANQDHERDAALRLAGTTAESEAQQISAWFKARQADAEVWRTSPQIGDELRRVVTFVSSEAQRQDVQRWLRAFQSSHGYDRLALTDARGRVILEAVDERPMPLDPRALAAVGTAVTSAAVQFVDRTWSDGASRPLSWVVPLGGTPAVAAMVLSTELEPAVRSALQAWYDSSASAEAMVVGRDADRAYFLTRPRLARDGVVPVFSVATPMPVATRLASSGEEGEVEALDYRGVPVFAAVRQIAGTPWALIAKVDQSEVYAAANETTLIMGAALSAAACTVTLALALLWYRRELKTTEHIVGLTQEQVKSDDMVRTLFTAVAQTPLSIVITDLGGTISYVNPMFTQVTGYSQEEAIGQNPRILKSGELSADDYRQLWSTILSGKVWHGDLHNKRKNGELFWESATIAPLRDNSGQVNGFVALKREITADKIVKEEHARLQLELVQAQKMESIGRLASGVAHDFNNMLAVILGHAEMALDGLDENSAQREHLVEILQAGQRSSDLTRQLLAFARKQKANPRVLNLNHEIDNTLKMLRRLIGENVQLVWTPDDHLSNVFIDPAQVDQILANLSVNARDAIDGTGTITIETGNVTLSVEEACARPNLRPGAFVRLSIRDTGCGMSPEVLARLFEPFFTTKGEGKGTGLGTATVYGIVKQNQGVIDVQSAVGAGTVMSIYLPVAVQESEPEAADTAAEMPRGSETIVVVEDDVTMLSVCTRMLTRLGYTVVGCPSAAQALAAIDTHQERIDVLLTDVVMPGMNGRELADAITQRQPQIRVLFMSGYTADIIGEQGVLDEGMQFLSKPFSSAQLAAKIREVLK